MKKQLKNLRFKKWYNRNPVDGSKCTLPACRHSGDGKFVEETNGNYGGSDKEGALKKGNGISSLC